MRLLNYGIITDDEVFSIHFWELQIAHEIFQDIHTRCALLTESVYCSVISLELVAPSGA